MIWIYAHIKSERLIFVCDFIFGRILQEDYTLVYDTAKFNATSGIKLNYSNESLEGVQVIPAGLLEETGIRGQELNTGDGTACLYSSLTIQKKSRSIYFLLRSILSPGMKNTCPQREISMTDLNVREVFSQC